MAGKAEESRLGSSDFTFKDDLGAEYHTGVGTHKEAMGGGEMPPQQLNEVKLGPGAFGSPDPRTLGHHLLGDPDLSHADTAPKLEGEESETVNYKKMNNDDLDVELARRGIEVEEGWVKKDRVKALEDDDAANADEEEEANQDSDSQ